MPSLAETTTSARTRSVGISALVALRPRQWVKNLLLFAGIIFAAEIDDPHRWRQACVAFAAYCAASSAAYLGNDVRDVEADRLHPTKRNRPIAAGELGAGVALLLAGTLLVGAFVAAVWLGLPSVLCLACFVVLQAAYSARLKHVVLADVLVIALLFVLRAAAGAIAVDVRISPWLLVCTGLLALFLALGKRRAELSLVRAQQTPGRRVLDGYSADSLDRMLVAVAITAGFAYVLYTLTARDSYGLVVTIPFVVFGLARYLRLLRRTGAGEEPENMLLGDVPHPDHGRCVGRDVCGHPRRRVRKPRGETEVSPRLRRGCAVTVDRDDLGGIAPLELAQPAVDALPTRRDQVDEKGKIVETGVSLGNLLLLEPLEARDGAVHQPLDLAEVAGHREHLTAQSLLNSVADTVRERRLEGERGGAERLDLLARAAQGRLEPSFLVPALSGGSDPLLCSFQCLFIHAHKATLAIG